MAYTSEDYEEELAYGDHSRIEEAALKIAANVMRSGTLEQAVVDAYRSDTIAEEAAALRKALTDG